MEHRSRDGGTHEAVGEGHGGEVEFPENGPYQGPGKPEWAGAGVGGRAVLGKTVDVNG